MKERQKKMNILFIIIPIVLAAVITVAVLAVRNMGARKPAGYVIENVHIITGDGGEAFNKNVLISEGKITQISDEKITLQNAVVVDGNDKTLMPGLIDCHMHIQGTTNKSEAESNEFLKNRLPGQLYTLLKSGVTTIKELGAPESFIYKLRDKLKSNEILGPNMLIVGPNITAKDGHPAVTLGGDNPWIREQMAEEIENEDQARAAVKRLAANKVDFIKIVVEGGQYTYFDQTINLNTLDIKTIQALIDEAKKYNLKVTAHIAKKDDVLAVLQTDIYGFEHGVTDQYLSEGDEVIKLWKAKGVYYVPTIQVLFGANNKEFPKYAMNNLKLLHSAGVKVAMGTDNMIELLPGNVVHTELKYYVQAGLTEMEALVTATRNAAEYLGILDKTGTVDEGKDADLILLDSDPLADIMNISNINTVFKGGEVVFSKEASTQPAMGDYAFRTSNFKYTDNTLAVCDKTIEKNYAIESGDSSTTVKLDYANNQDILIKETFTTKNNLETISWSYAKPSDNTDITASVKDDTITLTGIFQGKEVTKTYSLNDLPWMQMSNFNLSSFVNAKQEKISYYAIGTTGRGMLNLTSFDSEKTGTETIEVNGKSYDCVKITTVMSEYSFIWKGISWHDKDTGVVVKYVTEGKEQNALQLIKMD